MADQDQSALENDVAAAIWRVYAASNIAREGAAGMAWDELLELADKRPSGAPAVIRDLALEEARAAIEVVRNHG